MVLFAYRSTLLGRSILLITSEVLVNAVCWVVAAILFARKDETKSIMYLALLAWTLGLRHGWFYFTGGFTDNVLNVVPIALDADHISAIDNATRSLISMGQLPVTCGLFFSLGHSTIVIVVTIAIAISSQVFDRMNKVGDIGGVVGAAVSGSFLFIVGLANSIILWRILRRRRQEAARQRKIDKGEDVQELEYKPHHNQTIMLRILGPVITFVNRPWKMYPVGVLFGFGFDTASSIALLGLSAIAKRDTNGSVIPSAHIVILPLLFTAGMSMVDSADSILMLYSYSGFPQSSWALIERVPSTLNAPTPVPDQYITQSNAKEEPVGTDKAEEETCDPDKVDVEARAEVVPADKVEKDIQVKMNVISGLSIILTLMSILVAFSISLITIMGLIGERCAQCAAAAEAEDGGGLAGSWWRAWARASDQSGYIGAAIVGGFLVIVLGWYGARFVSKKVKERRGPE